MSNIIIKQIIPNLYIGSNIDISDENFINYGIKNIISINNMIDNEYYEEYNILNINIKDNDFLIKSNSKIINLDFNLSNNFIENSYITNQNVLVTSNNIMLSAIFIVAFIFKKLNITIIDSINYVYKFVNVDIKKIPVHYISTLFEYYK
jgi:hypothetical protein